MNQNDENEHKKLYLQWILSQTMAVLVFGATFFLIGGSINTLLLRTYVYQFKLVAIVDTGNPGFTMTYGGIITYMWAQQTYF